MVKRPRLSRGIMLGLPNEADDSLHQEPAKVSPVVAIVILDGCLEFSMHVIGIEPPRKFCRRENPRLTCLFYMNPL